MGAFLFHHRALVMSAAFAAALWSAWWAGTHPQADAWWLQTAWQVLDLPLRVALLVTGTLCLAAGWLRTAAEGRLGNVVYGQDAPKQLLQDGPHGWMRNPLYLGTGLFFVATTALWAPLVMFVLESLAFLAALHAMVLHEEGVLRAELGMEFVRYCERVPRWVPRRLGQAQPSPPLPASAYGRAILGNLGILGLGVFRVGVGLGIPGEPMGLLAITSLLIWLCVLAARRIRGSRGRM